MKKKILNMYYRSSLAAKIRVSYLVLVIPIAAFAIYCLVTLFQSNKQYEETVNSIAVASDFNLEFKKDFDYETYLLIVGNRAVEGSNIPSMLNHAGWVVDRLESFTESKENKHRLESVRKYLINLETYSERIRNNLIIGNLYEENLEIWENDVQIVTTLVRETFLQYIYYEIQDIQESTKDFQDHYVKIMTISLMAFAFLTVLLIYASYKIPRSITKPIIELSQVTDQVSKGNLQVRSKVYEGAEVRMLSNSMNDMVDKINELISQVTTEQIRLRKAEFELLQAQINPHFLYNTLDAIVWLAEAGDIKKVVSMVGSLSEFFRTSLNQGKDMVTIREELQHVRSYLEIQQVRYQDILLYEINVNEELLDYMIPKITLQPIVENALYHGIKNKRGLGHIVISASESDDTFTLSVSDDGIGMFEEKLEKIRAQVRHLDTSEKVVYGLYNINERIRLNFGEEYGIKISSRYLVGTKVDVILPKSSQTLGT